MLNRRSFIKNTVLIPAIYPLAKYAGLNVQTEPVDSEFAKHLKPVGRILEEEGYYVWCNSPIYADDGNVHVFYSRWLEKYGMGGWIHASEIAHAIAESPESDFKHIETVLVPREGYFDATTCHNPHIKESGWIILPVLYGKFKWKNQHQANRAGHFQIVKRAMETTG